MKWKLKRTIQCKKCPWRKDVNPHDIPNGYDVEKHRAIESTIAKPGDLSCLNNKEMKIMACHESHAAHCVGWLVNQLGVGNNIGLRLTMRHCENGLRIRTIGEQHQTFAETLPDGLE